MKLTTLLLPSLFATATLAAPLTSDLAVRQTSNNTLPSTCDFYVTISHINTHATDSDSKTSAHSTYLTIPHINGPNGSLVVKPNNGLAFPVTKDSAYAIGSSDAKFGKLYVSWDGEEGDSAGMPRFSYSSGCSWLGGYGEEWKECGHCTVGIYYERVS